MWRVLLRYDGTSMEERQLLRDERVRKKRQEIEERKRQLEEVRRRASANRLHLTSCMLTLVASRCLFALCVLPFAHAHVRACMLLHA